MTHSLRGTALRLMVASIAALAAAAGSGCVEDSPALIDDSEGPPAAPAKDAGGGGGDDETSTPLADSGGGAKDSSSDADACPDGSCAPPKTGCAAIAEADFCDDFDNVDALANGKTKWDILETQTTDQPVLTLASDRAVSAPSSLLSRIIDATSPGARFVKTITKANFTEVTWGYDVFLDSIGTEDGFFLDDFQFPQDDTYGFRLVMFAQGSQLREIKVEHNHAGIGNGYTIEPALAEGAVALGKWHHIEQKVKFTFGADTAPANKVEYSLRIDNATAPAFTKEYEAPPRDAVVHARFAGMPLVFNKGLSAGLKINWDNHVVRIK
jgi:hypothetical protein